MSETEVQAGPVVKVARDLTEIVRMSELLDDQAEHKHSARIDGTVLPGGLAMVSLAAVANHEAWLEQYATRERLGRERSHIEDEDDEWEPPLQTLCFWSEQWRREHNAEYDKRPTVNSEANFLRYLLDWAWDHEPRFDDFASDIRKARLRLENVLYAGERPERSRIECPNCEEPRRLIVLRGIADDCSDDLWKCPECKHRFERDDVKRAHAKMLRSKGAERWVRQIEAIWTLREQGRPERTVRQWLSEYEHAAYCDPDTHEVWVWWPDLWRRHLVTPTRNRAVKSTGLVV